MSRFAAAFALVLVSGVAQLASAATSGIATGTITAVPLTIDPQPIMG